MSREDRAGIENGYVQAIVVLQLDIDRLTATESRSMDLADYPGVLHELRESKRAQSELRAVLIEHRYKWACDDMKEAIKELGELCRELPDEVRHARVVDRVMVAQEEQRALIIQMYGIA